MQPEPQRTAVLQQARLLGDVGERAVAVVAVEDVLAPVGDEEIVEAVVVVVADGDRRRPAGARQAGLRGHVGERAVAIVLVQAVGRAGGRAFEARAAEDEDIQPAVVVVVEEGDAAADGFEDVGLGVGAAVDDRLRSGPPASRRR